MARRFTPEEITKIQELTGQGVNGTAIARLMKIDEETFRRIAAFHNIALYKRGDETKRRDDWIRQWYTSMLTSEELVQKYRAEINPSGTKSQIYDRAGKLKIQRPVAAVERERLMRLEEVKARNRARIVERLAVVQAALDGGANITQASVRSGVSTNAIYDAIHRGDIKYTPPAKVTKTKKTPRVSGRFETVEEWLAAGNQITRCPAAAVHYTTATISQADRLAIQQHAYEQLQDGNMWKAQRRAHFDAIDRGMGKSNG